MGATAVAAAVIGCVVGPVALASPASADPAGPHPCYFAKQSMCPPGTAISGADTAAPPPPPAPDPRNIDGYPIASGNYSRSGVGGTWFETTNGQWCVIEHEPWFADDDAKCNFVPAIGGHAGDNQTYAGTSTAGEYQPGGFGPPPMTDFGVLPVGSRLVNGRAACAAVDGETVTCTAGAHGFTISAGAGDLW